MPARPERRLLLLACLVLGGCAPSLQSTAYYGGPNGQHPPREAAEVRVEASIVAKGALPRPAVVLTPLSDPSAGSLPSVELTPAPATPTSAQTYVAHVPARPEFRYPSEWVGTVSVYDESKATRFRFGAPSGCYSFDTGTQPAAPTACRAERPTGTPAGNPNRMFTCLTGAANATTVAPSEDNWPRPFPGGLSAQITPPSNSANKTLEIMGLAPIHGHGLTFRAKGLSSVTGYLTIEATTQTDNGTLSAFVDYETSQIFTGVAEDPTVPDGWKLFTVSFPMPAPPERTTYSVQNIGVLTRIPSGGSPIIVDYGCGLPN